MAEVVFRALVERAALSDRIEVDSAGTGGWHVGDGADPRAVAVLADGSVACWGLNTDSQCDVPRGIGTPENPVASVAAGRYHTVAVLADGSVACWGDNYNGQCTVPSGIGTPENPITSVVAGGFHTVSLLVNSSLACWGSNNDGQCDVPSKYRK